MKQFENYKLAEKWLTKNISIYEFRTPEDILVNIKNNVKEFAKYLDRRALKENK